MSEAQKEKVVKIISALNETKSILAQYDIIINAIKSTMKKMEYADREYNTSGIEKAERKLQEDTAKLKNIIENENDKLNKVLK